MSVATDSRDRKGFRDFVDKYVRTGNTKDARTHWKEKYRNGRYFGLTALHYACMGKYGDRVGMVEMLLFLGCDIEAEEESAGRYKPVDYCLKERPNPVLDVLLKAGCQTRDSPRNSTMTPNESQNPSLPKSDIVMRKKNFFQRNKVESKRSPLLDMITDNPLSMIIDKETGRTLFDELLNSKEQGILEEIKAKRVDSQEIEDWISLNHEKSDPRSLQLIHECLLYRCIIQKYINGAYVLVTADIVNRPSLFMGPTAIETAALTGNYIWVREILYKLVMPDESWSRAEKHSNFKSIFSKRRDYLKVLDDKGFTRLHVAVVKNDKDMVDYMLNNNKMSVECHKKNAQSFDIDHAQEITLERGVITRSETIYSLNLKVAGTIYPSLLALINEDCVNLPDGNNNTLLHISAVALKPKLCSKLIAKSANVNCQNDSGYTPLMALLKDNIGINMDEAETKMIETVKVLKGGGATLNMDDILGCNILETATLYHNEKLLLVLIHGQEHLSHINLTQFLEWLYKKHYTLVKEVIPLISDPLLKEWITQDLIKDILEDEKISVTRMLYDHATYEVKVKVVHHILFKAASMNKIKHFRALIMDDVQDNIMDSEGESLLIYLIRERKKKFIDLVITSINGPWFVVKKNAEDQLPLHVCIETEYWRVLNQLIVDTIDVNIEDTKGNTPLSLLLTKISETEDIKKISRLMANVKLLINKSGDIYLENKFKMSVLAYCTKSDQKSQIKSYFQTQRSKEEVKTEKKEVKKENVCCICEDEPKNCALECGHVFCMTCAEKTINCYFCRRRIEKRLFIYL